MNAFTNLFFPQIQQADPHAFDDADDRYAGSYGNAVASARFFAPLGHARTNRAQDAAPSFDADIAACGCG
ncbi:hypothetical protein [Lysobacter auxotrophicus]|uniref:Uncharacterized protein n=1 Tax=Lysobacter auxotrophicus TaxID=2992573 RepID=A0ABM8DIL5_9GAMM|nr:hypothetical protein [Lysobacter auxotrophicus]BDU18497.1 hypothetical protein LA521A_36980 [Lysobacter auxotrophicus]